MTLEDQVGEIIKNNVFVLSNPKNRGNTHDVDIEGPANFEKAIEATGFGKFNIILLLVAIPSAWSSMFETTTMSFVFPAAQCDLDISLNDKGYLNAVTYLGMISTAFIWGYLCDTLGRRKLLLIGLLLDAVLVFLSSVSQHLIVLMILKFLGGFIVNGPFAALTTYISEFHPAKHRARIQMVLGTICSAASVFLPLLAWAVLPTNIYISLFDGSFKFHSWNLYLMICSLPPLIGGIAYTFLPESPKFLMTVGENEKALKVFRSVYSMNTGKAADSYPIKTLIDESKLREEQADNKRGQVTAHRTKSQALKEGWQQIVPLFYPPYLVKIILVCLMQMFFMMSLNTLRLWLPQIFQAINDYKHYNNGSSASLCTMLEFIQPATLSENITECVVNFDNAQVYINSIIVACVTMTLYVVTGYLINMLGKKRLLCLLGISSGTCASAIYFAQNTPTAIALSSLYIAQGSVCINGLLSVVVDLFPTTLRTMAVSLTMMTGRSGAMLGNIVFPLLLKAGCAPPFFSVGFVMIGCGLLSVLLPNTNLKAMV